MVEKNKGTLDKVFKEKNISVFARTSPHVLHKKQAFNYWNISVFSGNFSNSKKIFSKLILRKNILRCSQKQLPTSKILKIRKNYPGNPQS